MSKPAVIDLDENMSLGSESSSDSEDDFLLRRGKLENRDMLSLFAERASGFYVEGEVETPREKPLLADLKEELTKHKSEPKNKGTVLLDEYLACDETKARVQEEADLLEDNDDSLPPWSSRHYSKVHLGVALHEEILDFLDYLRPRPEELAMRNDVVDRIRGVVQKIWPSASVVIYGSFESGLMLPTSDIDMGIFGVSGGVERLDALADALRAAGMESQTKRMQVIKKARVPIIKFTDAFSEQEVDMSFDTPNGRENTELVKELLGHYPSLRPLVLVLKCFLDQRGLNDVYTGGLGSYAMILLMLSHIQHHECNVSAHMRRSTPLGKVLLDFFGLFGKDFNYITTAISVKDGGSYFAKKSRTGWYNPDRPQLLALEDPQNEENDVARNSYNILKVRQAFEHAFHILATPELSRGGPRGAPLPPPSASSADITRRPTLLNRIIRADYRMEARRKKVVELYAIKVEPLMKTTTGAALLAKIKKTAKQSSPAESSSSGSNSAVLGKRKAESSNGDSKQKGQGARQREQKREKSPEAIPEGFISIGSSDDEDVQEISKAPAPKRQKT